MKKIIGVLGVGLALFLSGSAIAQQSAPASGLGITRLVIAKRQIAYGGASFGTRRSRTKFSPEQPMANSIRARPATRASSM